MSDSLPFCGHYSAIKYNLDLLTASICQVEQGSGGVDLDHDVGVVDKDEQGGEDLRIVCTWGEGVLVPAQVHNHPDEIPQITMSHFLVTFLLNFCSLKSITFCLFSPTEQSILFKCLGRTTYLLTLELIKTDPPKPPRKQTPVPSTCPHLCLRRHDTASKTFSLEFAGMI